MELKYGLVFWFACVFLFIGPQMEVVEGLECPICLRIGKSGSKSCVMKKCDTVEDVASTDKIIAAAIASIQGSEEFKEKELVKSIKKATPEEIIKKMENAEGDGTKVECVKGIGKQELADKDGNKVPLKLVQGNCQKNDKHLPPKADPYENFATKGIMPGTIDVQMDKMWICDEKNAEKCKMDHNDLEVTEDEWNAGLKEVEAGAEGGAKGLSSCLFLVAVSGLLLLSIGQLLS